jgi:DNA topoisomerase-1
MARRIRRRATGPLAIEPTVSAEIAGLRYVNDLRTPGIRRIGRTKRFRFVDANGRAVSDRAVLARIKSLVIPPAWTAVWICPNPLGHLQATGRDARTETVSLSPAMASGSRRGEIRAAARLCRRAAENSVTETAADLKRTGLPREKVLATVVELLEKTLIRVGNEEYARDNNSYGLTTMRSAHAKVNGSSVRFEFRGKSGKAHSIDLQDARLARIVKACRDLPGYELFQYVDEEGQTKSIESSDVNDYLREICTESFTAKDFRTWAGTVLTAGELCGFPPPRSLTAAKKNILQAVKSVAARLGNTTAVCRKCYIHPAILEAYMDGDTIPVLRARAARRGRTRPVLTPDESAVVAMIQQRLR